MAKEWVELRTESMDVNHKNQEKCSLQTQLRPRESSLSFVDLTDFRQESSLKNL